MNAIAHFPPLSLKAILVATPIALIVPAVVIFAFETALRGMAV